MVDRPPEPEPHKPGQDASSESPSVRASLPPEPGDLPRARRIQSAIWLVLPLVALAELVGHGVIVARVPPQDDWAEAAAYVREQLAEGEEPTARLISAPYWTDPLLRHHLGDEISMAMAGASDSATFERIYQLSIRGHRSADAPTREPDAYRRFGRVTVSRWDLGPSTVQYDFVEGLRSAVVEKVVEGAPERCSWRRQPVPRRTGLAQGSITPAERFQCSGAPFWVGTTVVENLDYKPHFCIYHHPHGAEPIRATFRNVPLGERLVFYGGLYNRHEREGDGAPITARILVDGAVVGQMVHRDLDGWKAIVLETRSAEEAAEAPDAQGSVTVEVSAPNNRFRTFCWTATTRKGQREAEL